MEDVIFAGTRDRKPTGMAEVSLTLADPEVYDGSDDANSAPDVVVDGQPIPIPPVSIQDWDETKLRAEQAAETEDAVAEAQPGHHLRSRRQAPQVR